MTPHTFVINVQHLPPVAKRGQHVLVLLEDGNHDFVLGQKDIYPPNICRMVGGGVENGETSLKAASREVLEELGIGIPEEKFKHIGQVIFRISDRDENVYLFTTNIYWARLSEEGLIPSSDLNGIVRLEPAQMEALVERYALLPKKIDPLLKFSWFDYGQIYGPIHQIALQAVYKKRWI